MKKIIFLISCLWCALCFSSTGETIQSNTAPTNRVVFLIANSTKNSILFYDLIDPRGVSHTGSMNPSRSAFDIMTNKFHDTATITFDDNDNNQLGVYMLHYRTADWFWNQTLYADDKVIIIKKNSKVICSISDEGKEVKINVIELESDNNTLLKN